MEYDGNVTKKSNNRIVLPLHAYLAGGKLYGYMFLRKANFFPTTMEYNFNLSIMVVETSFEKVTPTQ